MLSLFIATSCSVIDSVEMLLTRAKDCRTTPSSWVLAAYLTVSTEIDSIDLKNPPTAWYANPAKKLAAKIWANLPLDSVAVSATIFFKELNFSLKPLTAFEAVALTLSETSAPQFLIFNPAVSNSREISPESPLPFISFSAVNICLWLALSPALAENPA